MNNTQTVRFPASRLMSNLTLTVEVTGTSVLMFRIRVAIWLLRCAAVIAGTKFQVVLTDSQSLPRGHDHD